MCHLFRIKRESDKLVIEALKASLTEITGLSVLQKGGQTVCLN